MPQDLYDRLALGPAAANWPEALYNDAIPLEMLRTEQKRPDLELAAANRGLETLSIDLDKNERYLRMTVELAHRASDA